MHALHTLSRLLCVVVAGVAGVSHAAAPAVTAEPAGLARIVKAADKAVVDKALKDHNAEERCKAALTKSDMNGLYCRLAVAAAAATSKPLVNEADVDGRAALVTDALVAGEHIAAYAPKAPETGLRRTRFEAHRVACDIAFAALAEFEAMPAEFPGAARAKVVLAGVSTSKALPAVGLRDAACGCAQGTVNLAVAADAGSDEQAAAQGLLTRNRCLLAGDHLVISDRKDPGVALNTGADSLRNVAQASSPEGLLAALARGRLVEMARCTDKGIDATTRRVKDKDKVGTCACNVVKHWPLPVKKDDPKFTARLPLLDDDSLFMPVTVEQGVVSSCGQVEGPLLAP